MSKVIIYHNGECSKSKGALELLQDAGVNFEVRWYLTDPLTKEELKALLQKLGTLPSEIIRKGEPTYKELFEGKQLTEDQWLDALVALPVLLERPIVEKGDKAMVARPPEIVNTFI